MALDLTASQGSVVDAVDADLETAYAQGVTAGGSPLATPLPALSGYAGLDPTAQKRPIKDAYRAILAALLHTQAGLTVSIGYKKADGSNGTLTFTNGILTGAS